MFLKDKLDKNKEKEEVRNINAFFITISQKEEELIDCLENPKYTESYFSMLSLKTKFLVKEIDNMLKKLDASPMQESIKIIHIRTLNQILSRINKMGSVIEDAKINLKTANTLENNTKILEMINKIKQERKGKT